MHAQYIIVQAQHTNMQAQNANMTYAHTACWHAYTIQQHAIYMCNKPLCRHNMHVRSAWALQPPGTALRSKFMMSQQGDFPPHPLGKHFEVAEKPSSLETNIIIKGLMGEPLPSPNLPRALGYCLSTPSTLSNSILAHTTSIYKQATIFMLNTKTPCDSLNWIMMVIL